MGFSTNVDDMITLSIDNVNEQTRHWFLVPKMRFHDIEAMEISAQ